MDDRTSGEPTIDDTTWEHLRRTAREMTELSAPYSGVRVGAAALAEDGTVIRGCNVENASTGLGVCAEVNLCGHLVAGGRRRLRAISIVARDGDPISPCGRCRQFLFEFGGVDVLVDRPGGPRTLGSLLPDAFGPDDVAGRAG